MVMVLKSLYLRQKDRQIFYLIVEEYLKNGYPVSSGIISKKTRPSSSSATVRNAEKGQQVSPHTARAISKVLDVEVGELFEWKK